ncbi:hypothetical protein BH11MYX1_BH11MYX1_45050 [soil metagenome]
MPAAPAAPAAPPAPSDVKITGIEPAKGDVEGGTYVKLGGARLLPVAGSFKVYFGSRQGEVVRVASDKELIVQAPGGKPVEVVDVLVVFQGGEIKLPHAFTFVER